MNAEHSSIEMEKDNFFSNTLYKGLATSCPPRPNTNTNQTQLTPIIGMRKSLTRPNLRVRSFDALEEERCKSHEIILNDSLPLKSRSTGKFDTKDVFVHTGSGDSLIEQLASCSSCDSLNLNLRETLNHLPAEETKESKKQDFLQLKKPRRGEKLSSSSTEMDQFAMYNNGDYWQDFVLPRGSLTTISHNMNMGPIGEIQTALFRNKYRVALKTEKTNSEELQKELILLKYLGNYPTILSCYGYVMNKPSLQIVYELAPYGSLDKVLKENKVQSFPLPLIVSWLTDLADAMQFLHSKGIIHGDIKAENILVFERLETKLCNFTSSKSILSDSALVETFSGLSFVDTSDHKLITSYSYDMTGFFNTVNRILGGKTAPRVVLNKTDRDRQIEEILLNRPFLEFSAASKLFYVLSSYTEYEQSNHQFHRYLTVQNNKESKLPSKQLSEQLFSLIEEFCDGDPREPLNENYKKLQRYELLIKSKIDNFVPIPPKSRLRQKLFGSSTLRRFFDIPKPIQAPANTPSIEHRISNSPTSVANAYATAQLNAANNDGFSTQKVIDPRTTLTEWLIVDYDCSFAEAEEFSMYFLRNGINSKEGVTHMLEITPNFLHKYGSNYELAGRIKEELLSSSRQ